MNIRKKARWAQVGAMALLLTIGAGGISGASADEVGKNNVQKVHVTYQTLEAGEVGEPGTPIIVKHSFGSGLLSSSIHQRNYWKLLVAAYAPELSGKWAIALDERKKLDDSLPKFEASVFHSSEPFAVSAVSSVPATTVTTGSVTGHIAIKGETIAIHGGANQPLPPESVNAIISTQPSVEIESYIEFNKAVESDDAESIRKLLPQLLESYMKETDNLKQQAEAFSQTVEDNANNK